MKKALTIIGYRYILILEVEDSIKYLEVISMTRFEALEDELRKTKNGFRRTCIKQEIDRLTAQFDEIDLWV